MTSVARWVEVHRLAVAGREAGSTSNWVLLFRLCSVRRRSAAANNANQRAVKSQVTRNNRRYSNHCRKFELYFDVMKAEA
jgi:hypothetical protein